MRKETTSARADLQRAHVILSKLEPDWRPQAELASARERLEEIGALFHAQ